MEAGDVSGTVSTTGSGLIVTGAGVSVTVTVVAAGVSCDGFFSGVLSGTIVRFLICGCRCSWVYGTWVCVECESVGYTFPVAVGSYPNI